MRANHTTRKSMARLTLVFVLASLFYFGPNQQTEVEAYMAPELPRVYINTTYPTLSSSRTIRAVKTNCAGVVNCYTSLQTALDQAILGDEIVVDAGMTIVGPIKFKSKPAGSNWITVRSSRLSELPAGIRVKPEQKGSMAKITSAPLNVQAVVFEPGAHHYRLSGFEIEKKIDEDLVTLIDVGNDTITSLSQVPHNITLDRLYVHGDSTRMLRRCVALHSAYTAIIDSYIDECHAKGSGDSQAVAGWNGPGPFKIVNNFLEGAAENIIFGGTVPAIDQLVPEDIEIRGNHFYKDPAWITSKLWSIKNIFELKSARRVLIDGNVFENSWTDGQTGIGILFKSNNPGGGACTWCETAHVTFTNNIVKNVEEALTINAAEGGNETNLPKPANNILIKNNLFTNVSRRLFFVNGGVNRVTFDHNTAVTGNTILLGSDTAGVQNTNFEFSNNIVRRSTYGIGSGADEGTPTLNNKFAPYVFNKNLLVNLTSSTSDTTLQNRYPAGTIAKQPSLVGFTNYSGGDFTLSSSSAYKNFGTDGKDLGVDWIALNTATAFAENGGGTVTTPPPPPPPVGDTTAPTVSISAPTAGTTVSGSSVMITVNVTDNVGVAGVTFRLDGNALGSEDISSPFSFTWNTSTIPNGVHTISAIARDTSNNVATSTGVSVTVNNVTVTPPPPPPPAMSLIPADTQTIVLHAADAVVTGNAWQKISDSTAASGILVRDANNGLPKISTAIANPGSYFELTFNAEANKLYHLWMRMKAEVDYYGNDSIHVQFSDSLDSNNASNYRIGTTASLPVILEEGSGAGISSWGWNDNDYGFLGANISFAISGTHTIRVQQREDGIAIDQIVLSPSNFLTTRPGLTKNDNTGYVKFSGPVTTTPPPPPPSAPTILSFTASPTSITSGGSSTLSWSVSNATSLSINQGIGTVTGSSRSVSPTATTTYILTATNAGGSVTANTTVTVNNPVFDFTLTNGGSKSVTQGSTTTNLVSANLAAGAPTNPISYSVSGLPAGATGSFTSTSCSPTCSTTLSISTTASTPVGSSTVTVSATGGNITRTTSFILTVGDGTSPTVSVSAPTNNATVSGVSVTLSAIAVDNVAVAGVQFRLDGNTNIGSEVIFQPYNLNWNTTTVSNGSHTITAVARDAAGNVRTSNPITVNVNNVVITPPTPPPPPPAPTVAISVNPTTITSGETAILSWSSTNATAINITESIGAVATSGSRNITPTSTTTYSITATNSTGSVTQTATITVNPVIVTPPSPGPSPSPSPSPSPTPTPTPPPGGGGTYDPDTDVVVLPETQLPTGLVFREVSVATVYLMDNGYKRPFTDPAVIQNRIPASYPILTLENTSNIPLGPAVTMRSGTLIKGSGPAVYLIINQNKYAFISAEEFLGLGYRFSQVINVSDETLNQYPITTQYSRPTGTLFKYANGSAIYYLEGTRKRLFPTAEIYLIWHGTFNKVVIIPATEQYEDGARVALPNGLLVKGSGPAIYVTENNTIRPFGSAEKFLGIGYRFIDVYNISDQTLDLQTMGNPI